ncbi:ATPase, partial [Blautia wexlerae]|nr:ATPase [Blautia wexlerae]
ESYSPEINSIIVGNNVRMSSSEDKRLGAYFVRLMDLQKDQKMGDLSSGEYDSLRKKESAGIISKEDDIRLAEIRTAMKQNRRFPEKVIKYLWDDAFKFNREVIFETTEYRSLESVIRAFMYAEGIQRFKMFKQNVVDALQNPESEQ